MEYCEKIINMVKYKSSFLGGIPMKNYDSEVKKRWGNTVAYKEHIEKTANYTNDEWEQVTEGLNNVMAKFSECKKSFSADSPNAQLLVKELQNYITENYYTCTIEILAGLGKMYVSDKRFIENIDKHANGTAEFISKAIEIYCK